MELFCDLQVGRVKAFLEQFHWDYNRKLLSLQTPCGGRKS